MLKNEPPRTIAGEPPRRWLADEYFDLIVWYQPDGGIDGFQLCYDKLRKERALTWIASQGFSHLAIDAGESKPRSNRTPMLVADGVFPAELVQAEFARRSQLIDEDLRRLVLDKIDEYVSRARYA